MTWHHLVGLATGVLTLTWVVSGLVSMNPWGFLESPDDPALSRIAGEPPTFGDLQMALVAVAARHPRRGPGARRALRRKLFVLAGGQRYDAQGRLAPLKPADLARAGASLGPVASQGIMRTEDAYYFTHHEAVTLPAWRVIRTDGTRVYLDPPPATSSRSPIRPRSSSAGCTLACTAWISSRASAAAPAGPSPWCCC